MAVNLVESIAAFLLVFLLPGYALTRATFPEWRIRGDDAALRATETAALSLVLSVSTTILVGFGLLNLAPGGFAASWSNPTLEISLGAITAVALVVAGMRGAFDRVAPPPPPIEPSPGSDDGWELMREIESLARQERRLVHRLRSVGTGSAEARVIENDLEAVREESLRLRRAREEEYAS